jgi:hypothetical protein
MVVLTAAAPLRAQEIAGGLALLGIAAHVHETRGVDAQTTGLCQVFVLGRDLDDAREALPHLGRDVIADPLESCPGCGHPIAGAPVERCPECLLALPVHGRPDPIAHFGPEMPGGEQSSALLRWFLTVAVVVFFAVLVLTVIF